MRLQRFGCGSLTAANLIAETAGVGRVVGRRQHGEIRELGGIVERLRVDVHRVEGGERILL